MGFSLNNFIDAEALMAKRSNSSGGPPTKSSQMDLLHFFHVKLGTVAKYYTKSDCLAD